MQKRNNQKYAEIILLAGKTSEYHTKAEGIKMNLEINEICRAVKGKLLRPGNMRSVTSVQTDSRIKASGSLFVPIRGERFDAHDFIHQAIENGASAILCEREPDKAGGLAVIQVEDTRRALGDLAAFYISTLELNKVAVTGSVGKTTTKEMLYHVLSQQAQTLKTEGNFNNDIGLPLTVFRLTEEDKFAVLEMGMSHFGEISYLSYIAKPHVGVITNVGHSHIENLGSREGILKAKLEIVDGLDADGTLILNGDDDLLFGVKGKLPCKTISFGIENSQCNLLADHIEAKEKHVAFSCDGQDYIIHTPGAHNVYNALAAITCGKLYGIEESRIKDGIEAYKPYSMRLDIQENEKAGIKVIVDCYNASPDSLRASLGVLADYRSNRTIAVLGSVAELGNHRDCLLFDIGRQIKSMGIDVLVTTTDDCFALCDGAIGAGFPEENIYNFSNNSDTNRFLDGFIRPGDVVLTKGSRIYKLEEVAQHLLEKGREEV